ncbi:HutD family protein [Cohnella thermotolerans]|uniref:HutD/Ves family protein n=1 Tax=Cohnella thermotolerans TaxID=329858 RepID=UPI00041EB7D0|nr:HutD family protein [Cohnella thermotolerans]
MSRIEWEFLGKERRRISRWPGGTTAEIAIHPATAQYAARNFAWRISTATVEAETSEFTPLAGFSRILMVLEGELALHHEGHGSCRLKPYESAAFEGGWRTTSEGTARDLNLICADRLRAQMNVITVAERSASAIAVGGSAFANGEQWVHRVWYAAEGSAFVRDNRGDLLCRLEAGDALLETGHRSQGEEYWLLENAGPGLVRVVESVVCE